MYAKYAKSVRDQSAIVRFGFIKFNLDDYEVSSFDQVTQSFGRKRVVAPYLFVDVGPQAVLVTGGCCQPDNTATGSSSVRRASNSV